MVGGWLLFGEVICFSPPNVSLIFPLVVLIIGGISRGWMVCSGVVRERASQLGWLGYVSYIINDHNGEWREYSLHRLYLDDDNDDNDANTQDPAQLYPLNYLTTYIITLTRRQFQSSDSL